jgi:hypothetical protein
VDPQCAAEAAPPWYHQQAVVGIVSAVGSQASQHCYLTGPVLVEVVVHLFQQGGHMDKRLQRDNLERAVSIGRAANIPRGQSLRG